ncbi:MAG: hypothetical protein JW800_01160 [Candidatus Omnitrophica bacterium]|nr:hypothetical protein [Candidatus Omnitrophota bacterium]
MRFNKISLIIFAVCSISLLSYAKERDKVEFIVFLVEEKEGYGKNDPILIKFKLENKGKESVFVNKRFYINSNKSPEDERDIYFSVTSPDGKEMDYRQDPFDTGLPRTDDFAYLKPGEQVESKYDRNLRAYFEFQSPGEYEVRAVYQNQFGDEIGLDTFQKRLTSNTIKVKITN